MIRSKYGSKKTVVDGITFDSVKESIRYRTLKILVKAGHIRSLELQPRYPIEINGVKVCTYVADFRYIEDCRLIVEDVKGMKTPIYNLKKKLMKAVYGIDILET